MTHRTPFDVPAQVDPATPGQVKFLRSLLAERDYSDGSAKYVNRALAITFAIECAYTVQPAEIGPEVNHQLVSTGHDPLTKTGASTLIQLLKVQPRRAAETDIEDEDLEGFWTLVRDERSNGLDHADGAENIYKVQRAVHGSGHLYAKVLDPETGEWIIARGAVTELRAGKGTALTLDRAKELGHLYGRCISCGRTLTNESSIEAGIGPVCATKF